MFYKFQILVNNVKILVLIINYATPFSVITRYLLYNNSKLPSMHEAYWQMTNFYYTARIVQLQSSTES